MQELYNILSFKTFISPTMLFIFYYFGALLVPFISFIYTKKLYKSSKNILNIIIPLQYKIKFFLLFVGFFIFMEILWRMMFEYLFAFLQIRESLLVSTL